MTNLIGFYAKSDCEIKLNLEAKELLAPQKIEYSQAISSDYRELEYETRWTEEKISFEKSRVYPDLKIGPSFQIEEELGQRIKRYGVSLKLDLPIINWNRGGRQRARREHRLLKTKLAFKKEENEIVIENLMATYKITFDTLGRIPKKKDLLEKHHRIERLFLRGLISIPSMIDGHDQLLSLMEDRDRHEILAQKSFLKISQFTGRLHKVLGIGETQ